MLIRLSRGLSAVIDDSDLPLVAGRKWYAHEGGTGFYAAYCNKADGYVPMHRVIIGAPRGVLVDHWDGDTLNNRRGNLRPATNRENSRNRAAMGAVEFIGVRQVPTGKFVTAVWPNDLPIHLGTYETAEAAAAVYNAAAEIVYGAFARLNPLPADTNALSLALEKKRRSVAACIASGRIDAATRLTAELSHFNRPLESSTWTTTTAHQSRSQ